MTSVTPTGDGSVVLSGHTLGAFADETYAGGADFVAVKLDADGAVLWTWQVRASPASTLRRREGGSRYPSDPAVAAHGVSERRIPVREGLVRLPRAPGLVMIPLEGVD